MLKPQRSINTLFELISQGNKDAFDELFLGYYGKLVSFAKQYVNQEEVAEEIAAELFVKIWLRRSALGHILNPEVYLYVSAKNAALNHLRYTRKYNALFLDHRSPEVSTAGRENSAMESKEFNQMLDKLITSLPEQRRIIFNLIKDDGLKSKEVAAILNISVRTVENQMYKAVKALADTLSNYLGYNPQHRISRKNPLSDFPMLIFF